MTFFMSSTINRTNTVVAVIQKFDYHLGQQDDSRVLNWSTSTGMNHIDTSAQWYWYVWQWQYLHDAFSHLVSACGYAELFIRSSSTMESAKFHPSDNIDWKKKSCKNKNHEQVIEQSNCTVKLNSYHSNMKYTSV